MRIDIVYEGASSLAAESGLNADGETVQVANLARAIGRQGHEVVVHTRRDDPLLPDRVPFADNVWVEHVEAGAAAPIPKDELLPFMPQLARRLSRRWRTTRPDAVHSRSWMAGSASLDAARPLGIPVVHTYHGLGMVEDRPPDAADTAPAERIDIERRLACEAARVLASSDQARRELVAMGCDPARISVVPDGVDLTRFTPRGAVDRRSSRRRRVVVSSRLVDHEGVGDVLAALSLLPDVELMVAGGPPAGVIHDDPAARRFLQLAADHGVSDRVCLRGAMARERLPGLLRSADVVVCCSGAEPSEPVAVEAMACGVPVVAPEVGGLAEIVLDRRTGILVPPGLPDRIADAVAQLLDNEGLRRTMGVNGVRRAQRFGWDRIATETLSACEAIVPSRTPAMRTA